MISARSHSQGSSGSKVWVRIVLAFCRVLLGAIFIVGAYHRIHFNGQWHLRDYFFYSALSLDSYRLLPLWAIWCIAAILPWFELTVGVFLIVGAGLRWSGLLASACMALFYYMLIVAQLRDTGGGFAPSGSIAPVVLVRDSVLLVLALAVTIGAFLLKKRDTAAS
jgi:hypothetical protein